jgi:hypothetical protein
MKMNNPWNNISSPSKDVNARRIDHMHPLELFWARDHFGHYLFIYEFSAEKDLPKIITPDLVGIQTAYLPAAARDDKNRLILLLKEQGNWEIFLSLCNDLIQATQHIENTSAAVESILMRLDRWHEFLKKNRSIILSEEKILGLLGELLFIRNHLIPVFGAGQSIQFWHGPEGSPQDFNVNESAIEVKCQSATTLPYVKISSMNQLCSQLPTMYLFVVTLSKAELNAMKSITLPKLISQIREALKAEGSVQVERFNDLLYMIGYLDSDHYLDFSYIPVEEKMFLVKEGFPRICPKDLRAGILFVSYSISLSECAQFEQQPDWMQTQK